MPMNTRGPVDKNFKPETGTSARKEPREEPGKAEKRSRPGDKERQGGSSVENIQRPRQSRDDT